MGCQRLPGRCSITVTAFTPPREMLWVQGNPIFFRGERKYRLDAPDGRHHAVRDDRGLLRPRPAISGIAAARLQADLRALRRGPQGRGGVVVARGGRGQLRVTAGALVLMCTGLLAACGGPAQASPSAQPSADASPSSSSEPSGAGMVRRPIGTVEGAPLGDPSTWLKATAMANPAASRLLARWGRGRGWLGGGAGARGRPGHPAAHRGWRMAG